MTPAYTIELDIQLTESQRLIVTGSHYATDPEGYCDGWREGPEFHLDYGGVRCPIGRWHALDLASSELCAVDVEQAQRRIDEMARQQALDKHVDERSAA